MCQKSRGSEDASYDSDNSSVSSLRRPEVNPFCDRHIHRRSRAMAEREGEDGVASELISQNFQEDYLLKNLRIGWMK